MIIYYTCSFTGRKGESHELLERAIARYTGSEETASDLIGRITEKGRFGKPVIEGFRPFSITHSRSLWAVLIAEEECGLDVQYYRKCDAALISGRFYAPEDAELIREHIRRGKDPEEEFFRIWARREALIKAVGGSVAETDVPAVMTSEAVMNGKTWIIRDIELPGGADKAAALCILKNSDTNVVTEELR